MAIAFAVGGDMNDLSVRAVGFKSAEEALGKTFAAVQQAFEGDGARAGPIVEEDGDGAAFFQTDDISAGGIDGGIGGFGPGRLGGRFLFFSGGGSFQPAGGASERMRAHWWGARRTKRIPFWARRSRDSESTAVSGSHMPSGMR